MVEVTKRFRDEVLVDKHFQERATSTLPELVSQWKVLQQCNSVVLSCLTAFWYLFVANIGYKVRRVQLLDLAAVSKRSSLRIATHLTCLSKVLIFFVEA